MGNPDPTRRLARDLALACAALWLVDAGLNLVGVIAPARVYVAAALAFGACAFALARRRVPRRAPAFALLALAFVAALAWWPWHGRKSFFRDVDALELGATRASVRDRMDEWPKGHPFGDAVAGLFHARDPRVDLWHHNGTSQLDNFDHVIVRYDELDRVRAIERIVD